MDDHTEQVLLFIDQYTAYVLDERFYPAKLPMRFLEANFTDSFKLKSSLQILYNSKLITGFVWGDMKKGNAVRTTSKGQSAAFVLSKEGVRHIKKRQLVRDGNNISLRDL